MKSEGINPAAERKFDPMVAMAINAWTDARFADQILFGQLKSEIAFDPDMMRNPAGDAPGVVDEIRCSETSPDVCNTLQCPTGVQSCFSQDCPGQTEPGGPGGPNPTVGSCSTNYCPTSLTCPAPEWPTPTMPSIF